MAIFLLFLGLLPIIFLPDAFGGGDESAGNGAGEDDLDIISPDDSDDDPDDFITDVDDGTVIGPDTDDDDPDDFGNPVGDGDVLLPDEEDNDQPQTSTDGSLLQQYLHPPPTAEAEPDVAEPQAAFDAADEDTPDETNPLLADDDADVGGDEDLIFEKITPVSDTDGEETSWLYHTPDTDIDPVEISGFSPGQDVLQISLNPSLMSELPEVSVAPSADGSDGIVTIDTAVIAILRGAPNVTLEDISIDLPDSVFG